MPRYFIKLSYDGTLYHGWQVQENTAQTIQQKVNEAVSQILGESIEVLGCGRTDTGVHAKEFYAHFDTQQNLITNPTNHKADYVYKFNALLPKEILISDLMKVKQDVNARFDAVSRTYEYIVSNERNPFLVNRAHFVFANLDMHKMNEAAQLLLAYEDFSCFSKSNTDVKTNICKVYQAEWKQKEGLLVFTITANRFLRNMVRAIVGTLIDIGKNKITIDDFKKIIESKNRSNAGESVAASGLYLVKVDYNSDTFV